MPLDSDIGNVARAIQLSIAPVFLLSGLAGLLGVIANRLARVTDRVRSVEAAWSGLDVDARSAACFEITNLERRRYVCSWSINCCTLAALLLCLVIITLFMEELFTTNLSLLASCLFVAAVVFVISGLTLFLREVYLATRMDVKLSRTKPAEDERVN